MSNRIHVGSGVEGPHGHLQPNPNPNVKRRVRARGVGTVLRAKGQHKWDVQFDVDGKIKECSSKSLKVVCAEVGIPVNEIAEYYAANRNILVRNGDSGIATITVVR